MKQTPRMFRVILQVSNLNKAAAFYEKLLGANGRRVHSSRHYVDCGPVILALVDPSGDGAKAKPLPDNVYFSLDNIKTVHARARRLGCLSGADVHGESGGSIARRPWGERSFYATDPFGNGLCFVEAGTEFTGRSRP